MRSGVWKNGLSYSVGSSLRAMCTLATRSPAELRPSFTSNDHILSATLTLAEGPLKGFRKQGFVIFAGRRVLPLGGEIAPAQYLTSSVPLLGTNSRKGGKGCHQCQRSSYHGSCTSHQSTHLMCFPLLGGFPVLIFPSTCNPTLFKLLENH